jgi:signal transduction histidine kinase
MDDAMSTLPATRPARPPGVRRDPEHRIIGGVAAGIARYFGVDPVFVRLAFVVAAAAGGVGAGAYVLAWVLIPAEAGVPRQARPDRRASVEITAGAGLLLLGLLLGLREIGVWFSDAAVWPLVLVGAGGAVLWRGPGGGGLVSRTGLGVVLVVAGGIVFLGTTGALSAARDVVLAVLVVVVGLAVIFAPWTARLARQLTAERAERIRSQERAEMAAHLHDSVLQTLALVQKRAEDPREVAALARRQERELRAWLSRRDEPAGRLVAALEAAAGQVEEAHGIPVEVVAVGDTGLDDAGEAAVAAAREAMTNAAKFGGGSPVDVYAEVGAGRVQIFIRDRGPGFDPAAIAPDRHGVRESIVGRMERHGGRAVIRRPEGGGTEVELAIGDER